MSGEERTWRHKLPKAVRQLYTALDAAPELEVDPAVPITLMLCTLSCGLWMLLERLNAHLAAQVMAAKKRAGAGEDALRSARELASRCRIVLTSLSSSVCALCTLSTWPAAERALRAWSVAVTGPGGKQDFVALLTGLRDDTGCNVACREAARRLLLDLEHGKRAREVTRRPVTCLHIEAPKQPEAYPTP